MDNVDLANKETELYSIVLETHGTIEDKYKLLTDKGVFEEYKRIHLSYADKADKNLESLKRGLFIQWYAITEPGCFTGINELDDSATRKIISQIDHIVTTDNPDYELKWMLTYYFNWEFAFEQYKEFKKLETWIENRGCTELPVKIDRNEMMTRGQMGRYWTSLSRFE